MGIEWLREIADILKSAGIRAGEVFPSGRQRDLTGPVAAVGLRNLNCREGTGEFEIRILSPRALGGWRCQSAAAEAVTALETAGMECRMEPMGYREGCDCYEMVIIGVRRVMEREETPVAEQLRIAIGGVAVEGVTAFSAVQDRGRRLIGTLNQTNPVGITPGTGGWKLKMLQVISGVPTPEPEEPFVLTVQENGVVTSFQGCCWNSVTKVLDQKQSRVEWEGFALTGTEAVDEETEV